MPTGTLTGFVASPDWHLVFATFAASTRISG
jgi:hypothetical protein